MRLSLLLSVSLLLAWQVARAQTADDFFNRGAHSYITNNIPQALESVTNGLEQYPEDVKLKKLYELLKQQSQQQSQNDQSQQNKNQQSQQNQPQPQQSQKSQDNHRNEQNQQPQPQPSQQNQPPKPSPKEKQGGAKPENQSEPGQPASAGQMTPEAAKRLLDAQKGDEQFLQLKPQAPPPRDQRPIKDW